jgi:hypothetical protein
LIQTFQHLRNARWVTSKGGAFSAPVKDWKCITIHLKSIAEERDSAPAVSNNLILKPSKLSIFYILDKEKL